MREFFLKLFSENNSDLKITLFSVWHFLYLFVIIGGTALIGFLLRKKSEKAKERTLRIFAYLTIAFYVADFFIMPLSDSYDGISAYKLPFNICTLMAIMIPFVQFNKKFGVIKTPVVTLSMASSLMWMCYPGSALGGQPPFSYIIFQTFMYHGFVFAWAVLSVVLGGVKFEFKHIWKELVGILIILAWAAFGNAVYQSYDWFFITGSTFPFFPKWSMPFIVVGSVFGVCAIIYLIYFVVDKIKQKIAKKKVVVENNVSEQTETIEIIEK